MRCPRCRCPRSTSKGETMAVRAERMEAEAKARRNKADVCDLTHLKEYSTRLGDVKELRNAQGKLYRIVRLLKCHAKFDAGLGTLDREIEMVCGSDIDYGYQGELEESVGRATRAFLDDCKEFVKGKFRERMAKLDPASLDLPPGERPPDLVKVDNGKAVAATADAEKRLMLAEHAERKDAKAKKVADKPVEPEEKGGDS